MEEAIQQSQTPMQYHDRANKKAHKSGGVNAWSVAGGAALVLLAAAVIVNFHDIKRYIKISTM